MDNQITIQTSKNYKTIVLVIDGQDMRITVPNDGNYLVINSVFSDVAINPKSANEFIVKITDR